MWKAYRKDKADFAFKPLDDLEAYAIIPLMIMRKTKMARQAKSKVTEFGCNGCFSPYRYHFFNCLIPLPALCTSTPKYHSSLCHFAQTRVIADHKPSHKPDTYAPQFRCLLCPTTSHFPPNVKPPWSFRYYSKAIFSLVQYSWFSKTLVLYRESKVLCKFFFFSCFSHTWPEDLKWLITFKTEKC